MREGLEALLGALDDPELVDAVIEFLSPSEGIELVVVTDEDEYFPPPRNIRELQASGDAGVAQRRAAVGIGADGAERQANTGEKSDQFHGSSGGRQPESPRQCE